MFQKAQEGNCPLRSGVKSISASSPAENSVFGLLSCPAPTVLALVLRRFVRFTGFFPPPYVFTHRPPPSLQWVSFPPKRPRCNRSRFLAAVPLGPAFLRPSNRSTACLPACPALRAGSTLRSGAAVTPPRSGGKLTAAGQRGFH